MRMHKKIGFEDLSNVDLLVIKLSITLLGQVLAAASESNRSP